MKLNKLKKEKRREEDTESGLYGSEDGVANWAVTDSDKFERLSKQAKMESQRAPELWVPDGASRLVRFIDDEPIVSFQVYRFKLSGKWVRFVKPADGAADLFNSSLGLKASRVFVFRTVDIKGYTDKKGKDHTHIPRFLVAATRMYDQLRLLGEENGPLSQYNMKISRSGSGTSTTYMFLPKPVEPMSPMVKKAAAAFPKWQEFYKPLSRSEQSAIVARVGPAEEEDDD